MPASVPSAVPVVPVATVVPPVTTAVVPPVVPSAAVATAPFQFTGSRSNAVAYVF